MKHIKTYESFEHIPYVIKTVEEMLLQIEDFEFSTKVNLESQKDLVIEIKKDSQEFVVFQSGDIKDTLIEINEYLTLGEGFKLKDIIITRIPYSSGSISFDQLIKGNIRLLDCTLTYSI
jgi:hypothetical protein